MKKAFTSINLPVELVEELKVWRIAYSSCYGHSVTYAEMIRGMLDSLEEIEPGVVAEMDRMMAKNPELASKFK